MSICHHGQLPSLDLCLHNMTRLDVNIAYIYSNSPEHISRWYDYSQLKLISRTDRAGLGYGWTQSLHPSMSLSVLHVYSLRKTYILFPLSPCICLLKCTNPLTKIPLTPNWCANVPSNLYYDMRQVLKLKCFSSCNCVCPVHWSQKQRRAAPTTSEWSKVIAY